MGIVSSQWVSLFAAGMKIMSPEKRKQLIAIYPKMFEFNGEKTSFNLFGIECCDGWFELLKDLINDLKPLCEELDHPIKVNQVKEKYGTLRFYLSAETEAMGALIAIAEQRSAHTCEECGRFGSMRNEGHWYSVRCDECWNEGKR